MTTLCMYLWICFVKFTILFIYFNILITWRIFLCILFMFIVVVICLGHVIHQFWCLLFLKICCDFFRIFLEFYVVFCVHRPSLFCDVETDVERCPPSRRPRPRLWTMIWSNDWIWNWLVAFVCMELVEKLESSCVMQVNF